MTKQLSDTLQQRHLDFMCVQAIAGRADSAPQLGSLDHDRYFLGTLQGGDSRGILKKFDMHGQQLKRDEKEVKSREVSTSYYDAPGQRQRPMHADVYCRRKRVTFSPLCLLL